MKGNNSNGVIKIDIELKRRIEEFLNKGDNRIEYPSVKNFIDKAVLKLLDKEIFSKGGKNGKKK